jgi:spermidine/putrescine transport system substrate-binding protein
MSEIHEKLRMNRRNFLGNSALTIVGLAAGTSGLGASSAWAAEKSITAVIPGVILDKDTRAIISKATGISIHNVPYVSPTDTVAKLLAPGGSSRYDLMVSPNFFVKEPIMGAKAGDEKVQPFDLSKMPNAQDLQELFKDDMVTRGGKVYTIPIFWGYDSPLIRTDHIPVDDSLTNSWGVLFADKYAGKTALRDDAYQSIMATALHLGHKDPSGMNKSELNEVKKYLISKKKNFRTLWTKFGEAVNLMSSGEVWAMYGWMPMRAALQRDGYPVVNSWPKEGLLVWDHAAFIPKDTKNADLSEQVVNAMLSPDFGVMLGKVFNYGPVTKAALAKFSPEQQHKLGLDVPKRNVAIYQLKWPADMNAWIEAWAGFKAA